MFIGAQIIRPSDAKIKLAPAGPKRLELWAILLSLAANARCPLLVQSRHSKLGRTCPLSGVKRTSLPHRKMSAYDPKRTIVALPGILNRVIRKPVGALGGL